MIKHCVFMDCRDEVADETHEKVQNLLYKLHSSIDGFLDFGYGPNVDFEAKSQRYDIGFVITFKNRDALKRYEVHPDHLKLGEFLVGLSNGGHDGIIVFDLDC